MHPAADQYQHTSGSTGYNKHACEQEAAAEDTNVIKEDTNVFGVSMLSKLHHKRRSAYHISGAARAAKDWESAAHQVLKLHRPALNVATLQVWE
jgi:hypothetical protein